MELNRTTNDAYTDIVELLESAPQRETRGGDTHEILGVSVKSQHPRDRMFTRDGYNLAFQLQEAFAYWNGLNPGHVDRYNTNMRQFMTDGKLEGSAYGRYLRRLPHDQLERAINQLRDNPETRQAVINFHQSAFENYDGPDVACTVYVQFLIRGGQLHMITSMRSQDMLWGYPYDVNNFQWIQEVVAGILDVELGTYTHRMNSCHYYIEHEEQLLESKNPQKFSMPDIRLDKETLEKVMFYLGQGLHYAQIDEIPNGEIDTLEQHSQFYADWLRFMTAYEQERFHDGKEVDRLLGNMDCEMFKQASSMF